MGGEVILMFRSAGDIQRLKRVVHAMSENGNDCVTCSDYAWYAGHPDGSTDQEYPIHVWFCWPDDHDHLAKHEVWISYSAGQLEGQWAQALAVEIASRFSLRKAGWSASSWCKPRDGMSGVEYFKSCSPFDDIIQTHERFVQKYGIDKVLEVPEMDVPGAGHRPAFQIPVSKYQDEADHWKKMQPVMMKMAADLFNKHWED